MEISYTGRRSLFSKHLSAQKHCAMHQISYFDYDNKYLINHSRVRQTPSIWKLQCSRRAEMDHLSAPSLPFLPCQYPSPTNTDIVWSDNDLYDGTIDPMDTLQDTRLLAEASRYDHPSNTFDLPLLQPKSEFSGYPYCGASDCVPPSTLNVSYAEHNLASPPCETELLAQQSAPYQEQNSMFGEHDTFSSSEEFFYSPPYKVVEEEETTDKPYAKLIYEALMQAPGHRMMLRDIYDWFVDNTTKPQESGTNGWQNSIRHNLSMNQAFENDKSAATSSSGISRKANSVWILTEHAVRHGVQSTTRYRKSGPVKKGPSSRSATLQRQKSGAKGGRAACRRAGRSKKSAEVHPTALLRVPDAVSPTTLRSSLALDESGTIQTSYDTYRPPTPTDDTHFESLYALPEMVYASDADQIAKKECEQLARMDTEARDYFQFNDWTNSPFERMFKLETKQS